MGVEHLTAENRSRGGKLGAFRRWAKHQEEKLGTEVWKKKLAEAAWSVLNAPKGKVYKDRLREVLGEFLARDPVGFMRGIVMPIMEDGWGEEPDKEPADAPAKQSEEHSKDDFLALVDEMLEECAKNPGLEWPAPAGPGLYGGLSGQGAGLTAQERVVELAEAVPSVRGGYLPAAPALSYVPLCAYCERHGHPDCSKCVVANDPSYKLVGGMPMQTGTSPEYAHWPWPVCEVCEHRFRSPPAPMRRVCEKCGPVSETVLPTLRCEECGKPYQDHQPPHGGARLCPECR
jgi:hypothetical protein